MRTSARIHPLNLLLRFLLEIAALVAFSAWGWSAGAEAMQANWLGYAFAIALPLLGAAVWGTFAVRGDPSRSGSAPVEVSGLGRLIIEFVFFAIAVLCTFSLVGWWLSGIFAGLVLLHYILAFQRITWLLVH